MAKDAMRQQGYMAAEETPNSATQNALENTPQHEPVKRAEIAGKEMQKTVAMAGHDNKYATQSGSDSMAANDEPNQQDKNTVGKIPLAVTKDTQNKNLQAANNGKDAQKEASRAANNEPTQRVVSSGKDGQESVSMAAKEDTMNHQGSRQQSEIATKQNPTKLAVSKGKEPAANPIDAEMNKEDQLGRQAAMLSDWYDGPCEGHSWTNIWIHA